MLFFKTRRKKQYHTIKFVRCCFKPNMIKQIMESKGWTKYKDIADFTGFTCSYISQIKNGGSVSIDFLLMLMELTGNRGNWQVLYRWLEIVPRGEYNPNSQYWNQQKYFGFMKYTQHSISAEHRRLDWKVEEVNNFQNNT